MQIHEQQQSIPVLCVRAKSFPDGIMDSFNALEALLAGGDQRVLYGLSRPENGVIAYLAAASCSGPDEAAALGAEYMEIPVGRYVYADVENWATNIPAISSTFDTLCATPGLDPTAYCVEVYDNPTDVRCMIRLAD